MSWLSQYDKILISFSGGKDSIACIKACIEAGAKKEQIELWHQRIDGHSTKNFMDWPCTDDYVLKFAQALNIPVYFQWKVGGFYRELNRCNSLTAPTRFETETHEICQVGGTRGKPNTRGLFPQVSADLRVRWCSAYLKIDVMSAAVRNQPRFNNSKTLIVTGERAEESPNRAKYHEFEIDRSDSRSGRKQRHVDHWRPIKDWKETEVWEAMEAFKVLPHPAYRLGWGRLSCIACIFGSRNQWASLAKISPDMAEKIIQTEAESGKTIKRNESVPDQICKGSAYEDMHPETVSMALSKEYSGQIYTNSWQLPSGAFGENAGPN